MSKLRDSEIPVGPARTRWGRWSGRRAAEDEQEPEIGAVVSVEGGCGLIKSYTMSDGEDDEGEGEAVAAAGGAEPTDADAPAAAASAPAGTA